MKLLTAAFQATLVFPFVTSGCASLETTDWTTYDGPGKEHFLKEEVELPYADDPLEPVNRAFSGFNHVLMVAIVAPIGWVYRTVFPSPVRTGVDNAFDNLYYPVRLVGNLLQGKFSESWHETERFAVNTTVGVLGLWDPATSWGIEVICTRIANQAPRPAPTTNPASRVPQLMMS